jgi:hypothetical protein
MTETAYKELQAWCKKVSNKKLLTYNAMVERRNAASKLRNEIWNCKRFILEASFYLENSIHKDTIDNWTRKVNEARKLKSILQKQFNEL